jgi:Zn-dependent M28 family amino/carboxypeptidase
MGLRIFLLLLILAALWQGAFAQQMLAQDSSNFDARALLRDIETLSADDMGGRGIGSPGIQKARSFLLERFARTGLRSFDGGYIRRFEYKGKAVGANIVGYIPGARNPDKYIVVTAHYDHLGVRDGNIYNGADDNASGTAALLALAGYFGRNRPAYSIVFAAFDGEEEGLLGSRSFVNDPPVELSSILVNVNLDMISRSIKNELYAVGTRQYPALRSYLAEVASGAKIKLLFGHDGSGKGGEDWTKQSDQYPFHKKGIPFIYFGVEDHQDYHKPTDDFTNIDQTFYILAVETVLSTIKSFDKNSGAVDAR